MLSNYAAFPCDSEELRTLTVRKRLTESSEIPLKFKIFKYAVGITRVVGIIFIILLLVWLIQYRDGFSAYPNSLPNFNWHTFSMGFGMVFLYSNAMLVYKTEEIFGKQRLKRIHPLLMISGIIFTIPGIAVGIGNHSFEDRLSSWENMNLMNVHTILGFISLILFYIQCTVGFFSCAFPRIKSYLRTTYIWLATGSFVASVIAFLLGFNKEASFAVNLDPDHLKECIIILFILLTLITFGILSVYLFGCDCYRFFVRPANEIPTGRGTVFKNNYPEDKMPCSPPNTPFNDAGPSRIFSSQPHSQYATLPIDTSLPTAYPTPRLNNLNSVD